MSGYAFKLNPATLILMWLEFAVALHWLDLPMLATLSAGTAVALGATRQTGAMRMLRRARWLLLSLMLIYSFATPGDAAIPALGTLSPTLQGLRAGGMQAWRLALLLALLALLLHACPRETLLNGIYTLLRPFRLLGVNPERIAVRLWLTLSYAEQQPKRDFRAWWQELQANNEPDHTAFGHISVERTPFTRNDLWALLIALLFLVVAAW